MTQDVIDGGVLDSSGKCFKNEECDFHQKHPAHVWGTVHRNEYRPGRSIELIVFYFCSGGTK